jgi:hypothetical protein
MASTVVVKLAGDLYRAGIQVDVRGTERGEFRPAETSEGGQQDQRPVTEPDRIGHSVDVGHGQHRAFR